MPPVIDGQAVSAAVTNPAFLDAQVDDTALGKIGFHNADTASGTNIDNIQREVNSLNSFSGSSPNQAYNQVPTYTNNSGMTPNQNLRSRIDTISGKFDGVTGHTHTGNPGDGAPISASSIVNVNYRGFYAQGTDITAASGLSTNVSSLLSTKTPSSNQTTLGVVVNAPQNRIILRHATGTNTDDAIINSTGDQVYGRLTFSSGVWTLTYFVNLSGVETAYNLPSTDVRWYYQEIFNQIVSSPVYSDLAVTPSDNAAADVPYADETTAGKVLFSNVAPPDIGSTNVKGVSTLTAHGDHTHKGVHSWSISPGGTQLFGDVQIQAGNGISLSQSGNIITASISNFLPETTASIVNNQVSPANVTGMSFDGSIYRAAFVYYMISRVTTGGGATELTEGGELLLTWNRGAMTWNDPVVLPSGPQNSGLTFTTSNSGTVGQVQYTSSSITGTASISEIKFFARLIGI